MKHVRLVPFTFNKDIIPDYVLGQSTCAVFISFKYHLLHPKHVEKRIAEIGQSFKLRVVLALVDDDSNTKTLQELNKICFSRDFTLVLSWSNQEAARYLETLRNYENKSSSSIQVKEETEFLPKLSKILTSVRSVNKTDVVTLLDVFGSFGSICAADQHQMMLCPGIGEKKMKRLHDALHAPFDRSANMKSRGGENMFQANVDLDHVERNNQDILEVEHHP